MQITFELQIQLQLIYMKGKVEKIHKGVIYNI